MRAVLALLLLAACGGDPCADGSMVNSPSGLVVTEAEHGEGWGQAGCAGCHSLPTTHDFVCTEQIDGEALRALVDERGVESCADCHGDNGVSP